MSNMPEIVWFELDWDNPPIGRYLVWFPNEKDRKTADDQKASMVRIFRNAQDQLMWVTMNRFHFDFKKEDWPTHYALITPPK